MSAAPPPSSQRAGPGWWGVARRTIRASRRWGIPHFRNLVGQTSNWVQPVFDVDRARYDDIGGTQYAVAAGTPGQIAQFPSCLFVNRNDWELHEVNAFWNSSDNDGFMAGNNDRALNFFTPEIFPGGYNAVQFNLVGPFGPQLVTSYQLEQGDMNAFAGTQTFIYPGGLGLEMTRNIVRDNTSFSPQLGDSWTRNYVNALGDEKIQGVDKKMVGRKFSPAIRFPAERLVVFQVQGLLNDFNNYPVQLEVSLLYNEIESF